MPGQSPGIAIVPAACREADDQFDRPAAIEVLKQLRYFLGVLEAKSITGAAEIFHVAQPAIGMQIRNLEDELGVKLLVRHARGVMPTEAGVKLARRAEGLLRDFEQMRQDVMEIGNEPRGRVVVGMTAMVAELLAAPLAEACRRKFPDVALSIDEAMSQRVAEWITSGRLDLALTFYRPDDPSIMSQVLAEEWMHRIVPVGHPLAGASKVRMRDLLHHDLVLTTLKPSPFRAALEEVAQENEATLKVACETASVATALKLVCHGLGCAAMPLGAVHSEVEAGIIIALPMVEPQIRRRLYLEFSKKSQGSKAVNVICDELRGLVGDLVAAGEIGWERAADPPGPGAEPR